jgi:flagellar biosynthesis GTPase FlhF
MAVKESASLSESLISYEDFMSPKKIKEGFDPEAFKKAAGGIKKPAAGGGGGAPATFDAFDSKEEGNKFRAWVNDKHPEWAKENSLDKEGSHTNSYIKKAWDTFKDEYEKREADKDKREEEKKEKEEITESSAKEMAEKADEMLRDASAKVKRFYSNEDNFSEYKSNNLFKGGDNENAAVKYIFGYSFNDKSSWFYKNIRRKYTKPVYQTIKKLKEGGKKYENYYIHLQDELKKVTKLYSVLKKKTYGGTSSDTYRWSHTNLEGEKKSFYVDTDF